jgi:CHAT domain-containing protein
MTIDFKMIVAIQPEAPGSPTLHFTHEELLIVQGIVSKEKLIKLGVDGIPASADAVISHLPNVSVAHFACHGKQNMEDPLESCLILDGGKELKISRLMKIAMPNASLAFLSACETAMGKEDLPDEAMHLAASMLFAGFRGAVATMW